MPAGRKLATSRSPWLAIIPTCLAKIGILVPVRGTVAWEGGTVPVRGHVPDETAVDVLVRPEDLHMEIVASGNGIVTGAAVPRRVAPRQRAAR
jgi:hypothetical protein